MSLDPVERRLERRRLAAQEYRERHRDTVNAKARERMRRHREELKHASPEVQAEHQRRNRVNDAAYREGNAAAIIVRMRARRRKAKKDKRKAELARMVLTEKTSNGGNAP